MSPLRPSVIALLLKLSSHASDGRDASYRGASGSHSVCGDRLRYTQRAALAATTVHADEVRARSQRPTNGGCNLR